VSTTNGSERAKIFETVFGFPGMKEICKIDINPTRQTTVLLRHLMEQKLLKNQRGEASEIVLYLPAESVEECSRIVEELPGKSGLSEFSERLKAL
jgi:hypothetical protein